MTPKEASTYIEILHKHYNNAELTFSETRDSYRKLLMNFDYEKFATTLDDLIMTFKFCPKPPEIIEMYNRRFGEKDRNSQFSKYGENNCNICNDIGAILYRIVEGPENYEYTLHCSCQAGQKAQYDGRQRQVSPSPYITEPIGKYIDPASLRQQKSSASRGQGYETFLAECKRIGMSPKLILNPPERKVKTPCPF